jgi:hypothetical protein
MCICEEITSEIPTTLLYHYTSQTGIIGIVRNKSIWATDIQYLNDAAELQNAIELVRKEFRKKRELESQESAIIDEFSNHFESGLTNFLIYCVFSLSEEGDLLSQWRSYCPESGGYSIGFDPSLLVGVVKKPGFSLVKCIYDRTEQENIIRQLIDQSVNAYKNPQNGIVNIAVEDFFEKFRRICPMFKDPSFSEEREWRLVSNFPNLQPNFRKGKSLITPYVEIKLAAKEEYIPIKQVFIGPTPHKYKELSRQSVLFMLNSHNIRG